PAPGPGRRDAAERGVHPGPGEERISSGGPGDAVSPDRRQVGGPPHPRHHPGRVVPEDDRPGTKPLLKPAPGSPAVGGPPNDDLVFALRRLYGGRRSPIQAQGPHEHRRGPESAGGGGSPWEVLDRNEAHVPRSSPH